MIRTILALSLALLIVLAHACASATPMLTFGEAHRLHSRVLDEDRDYQIALPASYGWAQDRRYPVLYVLDGDTNFQHSAANVAFLAARGEMPEMIVVGIVSTVRVRDFTPTDWPEQWVGGGGAANFQRFLADELIPVIDKAYRSNDFRVLSGHSAGGLFALHALATGDAQFAAYFALAPSLDWDDRIANRELAQAFDRGGMARRFLYVARADDRDRALADYDELIATLRAKAPRSLRWAEHGYDDERHTTLPLVAQIDALRVLYAGYRLPEDRMDEGLAAVEAHYADVSSRLGTRIAVPEGVINDLGYAALGAGRVDDAIALFQRNVDANPNSANAYDSLADGHADAKQWRAAARASARAAALARRFDLSNRAYFDAQAEKRRAQLREASPAKP